MNIIRFVKRWISPRPLKRYLNEALSLYQEALFMDRTHGRKFAKLRGIDTGLCSCMYNITLPEIQKGPGKHRAVVDKFHFFMRIAGVPTESYITRTVVEAAQCTDDMYSQSILIRIALITHLLKVINDYRLGKKVRSGTSHIHSPWIQQPR